MTSATWEARCHLSITLGDPFLVSGEGAPAPCWPHTKVFPAHLLTRSSLFCEGLVGSPIIDAVIEVTQGQGLCLQIT